MPADFWYSPWVLGLLGLCVGSFLNVVVHRLPRMLERQWQLDGAYQLADADGLKRQSGNAQEAASLSAAASAWVTRLEALPAYSLAKPRSACPACGHQLAWHENLPLLGWLRLRGRCVSHGCSLRAAGRRSWQRSAHGPQGFPPPVAGATHARTPSRPDRASARPTFA